MTETDTLVLPQKSARYELLDDLGGGQAATYRARDRESGVEVVLKTLSVRDSDGWKAIELFKREAEVLRALDHPGIPKWLDAFVEQDAQGGAQFYLIQEYIEGPNLQHAVEAGLRVDEPRAREMLVELLDILSYLHAQNPPVIHRDVKPANIIMGEDGRLHLVDFGAVGRFVSPRGGSTIIGSAGYVPVEQLAGRARPASDLYALGATLVYLLSRRPPNSLPFVHLKLQFREATDLSEALAKFLDRLLEPSVEARPSSAQEALEWLHAPVSRLPVRWSGDFHNLAREYRPPADTRVTVTRELDRLEARIPGFLVRQLARKRYFSVVVPAALLGLALMCTNAAFVLFYVTPLLLLALYEFNRDKRIVLTPGHIRLTSRVFVWKKTKTIAISHYRGLMVSEGTAPPSLTLQLRDDPYRFGFGFGLAECNWLINLFEPIEAA